MTLVRKHCLSYTMYTEWGPNLCCRTPMSLPSVSLVSSSCCQAEERGRMQARILMPAWILERSRSLSFGIFLPKNSEMHLSTLGWRTDTCRCVRPEVLPEHGPRSSFERHFSEMFLDILPHLLWGLKRTLLGFN